VFKNFAELDLGDTFVVEMPYGDYTYEIKDTEIVDADDTTVVGKMGEEVLVVSTCYPFDYLGNAPERFVFYAYPVVE
jgi:sortase A